MNLIQRQIFNFIPISVPSWNTYIGGVSSTVSTAALLATKLGISISAISNFTAVGADIKCRITGSYVIPNGAFLSNTEITYYRDIGICTSYDSRSFANSPNLKEIYLPAVTSIVRSDSFQFNYALETIFHPICISYGSTAANDTLFSTSSPFKQGCILYVHQSMATINSGGVEGDLADAISKGAIVRYVTNSTSPNPITNLSTGIVYATAIQLNFTAPVGSINAIDYYQLYINGVYIKRIASGEYATGLTSSTSYVITIIAVDVFFNKSNISNSITQSTNTTSAVPTTGLVSYYKLDSNSSDSYGSNNGIDTSVSYVSGKLSNAASYNGTNSYSTIPDSNSLSFTNGTNDLPFSINFWVKMNATGVSFFVSKTSGGFANNLGEWSIYYQAGNIVTLFSNKTTGYLASNFSNTMSIGVWYNISMTYSGNGLNSGIKLYVNGVSKSYASINSGVYTSMSNTTSSMNFGQEKAGSGNYKLNGLLEEISIYNIELTQSQIDIIYNAGNGITL